MLKVKLSRKQWEQAGRKAGWIKTAEETLLETVKKPIEPVEPVEPKESEESEEPLGVASILGRNKYSLRNIVLSPFLSEEEFLKIAADPATPYGILSEMRRLRKCTPEARKLIEENVTFIYKFH